MKKGIVERHTAIFDRGAWKKASVFVLTLMVLALLCTGVALGESIPIDAAHFPDASFRAYVMENAIPMATES